MCSLDAVMLQTSLTPQSPTPTHATIQRLDQKAREGGLGLCVGGSPKGLRASESSQSPMKLRCRHASTTHNIPAKAQTSHSEQDLNTEPDPMGTRERSRLSLGSPRRECSSTCCGPQRKLRLNQGLVAIPTEFAREFRQGDTDSVLLGHLRECWCPENCKLPFFLSLGYEWLPK